MSSGRSREGCRGRAGVDSGINTIFAPVKEEWSEFRLEGGGSVRVQAVVTKVVWLTDESGNKEYHADGRPKLLVFRITNVNSQL